VLEASLPGVKQRTIDANHSSPSGAEVTKVWSYFCVPPTHLRGLYTYVYLHLLYKFWVLTLIIYGFYCCTVHFVQTF